MVGDGGRHEGVVSCGGRHGGMVGDGGRLEPELSATGRGILRWGRLPGDGEINRVVGFSQVEIFTIKSFTKCTLMKWLKIYLPYD